MNSQRAVRRSARLGGAVVASAGRARAHAGMTSAKRQRAAAEDGGAAPAAAPKRKATAAGPCRTLEKRLWAQGFARVAGE